MVVTPEPMVKGVDTNGQCQPDHADLKSQIIDDIDAEQGQTGQEKREQGTMNGTGQ